MVPSAKWFVGHFPDEENKIARKNRSVAFHHDRRLSRSGANLECNRSHFAIVAILI
jgi:hypothetical protein